MAALLRRTAGAPEEQLVWLTRAGDLELQDVDAAWLAAARAAVLEAGVPLTLVIVNRHGWWDPRSGAGTMSWVTKRSVLRRAEPPPTVSGRTTRLAVTRIGIVHSRAHSRRVPISAKNTKRRAVASA